jgi:hypothetical protein
VELGNRLRVTERLSDDREAAAGEHSSGVPSRGVDDRYGIQLDGGNGGLYSAAAVLGSVVAATQNEGGNMQLRMRGRGRRWAGYLKGGARHDAHAKA